MATGIVDRARERRKLRTALFAGLIALGSLAVFVYKVWQLG